MIDAEAYLRTLIAALKKEYGARLIYVGLQGSYLRGEADENSDIDVMTVIESLTPDDLRRYRGVLETAIRPAASSAAGMSCTAGTGWSCATCCTQRRTATAHWMNCCPYIQKKIRANSSGSA